ncbi:MAG: hypothetical protein TEF_19735 [Rhizobiales bacterium NRL2]|jgi:peptidoglycan hydrolase-like protein with peptidoglycan-binding domain|nr:MAG: hypothetical protein TEF_19735 [Rhizobiales bacterium NRL2]
MAIRELRRGKAGPAAVRELQALLNRVGAAIAEDGDFGPATERAVKYAQGLARQPANGVADPALRRWLAARPEPSPDIPASCLALIVRHEVASREHYERRLRRPVWPEGESGVTVGIGYDLRFHEAEAFRGLIRNDHVDLLKSVEGCRGSAELAALVAGAEVPWRAAWRVFCVRSAPEFIARTRAAFPNFDTLPDLCRGALFSLVYNRGASMKDTDSRREMREIRDLMSDGGRAALSRVPRRIRSMKRLWPGLAGLRRRRDDEADLFERGLAQQQQGA